jgi:hypothetical protein
MKSGIILRRLEQKRLFFREFSCKEYLNIHEEKLKASYAQENSKTAKHFFAQKANYRRSEKIDY